MWYLTTDTITTFFEGLGIYDLDIDNVVRLNEDINEIAINDMDKDFDSIKRLILNKPNYNKLVTDNTVDSIYLVKTIFINGCKIDLQYKITRGEGRLGINVSVLIKTLQAYVRGKLIKFPNIKSMENYKANA